MQKRQDCFSLLNHYGMYCLKTAYDFESLDNKKNIISVLDSFHKPCLTHVNNLFNSESEDAKLFREFLHENRINAYYVDLSNRIIKCSTGIFIPSDIPEHFFYDNRREKARIIGRVSPMDIIDYARKIFRLGL